MSNRTKMPPTGRARSGGGPNMNKVVRPPVKGGSPNLRKVNPGKAAMEGLAVGNHVGGTEGGGHPTVQRPNTPLYTETKAFVRMGNSPDMLNVGGGGPGKGYDQHGPSGSQHQYGPAPSGYSQPQGRDILSEFGPESNQSRRR